MMTKQDRKRAEMARVRARKDANVRTYETASIKMGAPLNTLSLWRRRLRDEPAAPTADAAALVDLQPVDDPHQAHGASLEVVTATCHRLSPRQLLDANLRKL